MNFDFKRVLYIDLSTLHSEFKMHEDLWSYVGGVGVGYKLLHDNFDLSPIVIATGPLSGYFPYISKTCLIYSHNERVEELYGGGSLAAHMNMADVDAMVITGNSQDHINIEILQQEVIVSAVGEKEIKDIGSDFSIKSGIASSQGYFSFGRKIDKDITDLSIRLEPSETLEMPSYYDYDKLYSRFLDEYKKLSVEPRGNPSCTGCPMGCDLSHEGEVDINVGILPRSLISCAYAEQVYKDIPTAYACLNSVGYNYHHADLERLPNLVGDVKAKISNVLNSKLEAE